MINIPHSSYLPTTLRSSSIKIYIRPLSQSAPTSVLDQLRTRSLARFSKNHERSLSPQTPSSLLISVADTAPPPLDLLCSSGYNALILPRGNILQRALEVPSGPINRRRVVVRLQIRVDELDEAIEVFGGDLYS
jgi:hypothetical protein